jgi:hypothetical protein
MSVLETDVQEPTAEELREALILKESVDLREAVIAEDGTVLLNLLRPCVGRGKGTRLYTPEMLRENAAKLTGWKMYVDHESDEARKKMGGLPRSVRDLGGRIVEAFWDPNVPAEGRFGQGAVRGRCKPTPFIKSLIENDPELVELSINSTATGIKPMSKDGQRVWLVEGIADQGSVDWVTEAGAGGKVAALMESVYGGEGAEDAQEEAVLESLTDDELLAHIASTRPELAEAFTPFKKKDAKDAGDGDPEDKKDGGADEAQEESDEFKSLVKKFTAKGMPQAAAEKAARSAMAAKDKSVKETLATEGDEVAEITAEALREAMETDEGRETILSLVREVAGDDLRGLVESAVAEERTLIRREAQAEASRQIELRDLREAAHLRIAESKLPEPSQEVLRSQFSLTESGPTPDLDVVDEINDDGEITKSASEKLAESVDTAIAGQRRLVGALRPAAVRGQGPSLTNDDGTIREGAAEKPYAVPARTAALLREAGFTDPDEVYAPIPA